MVAAALKHSVQEFPPDSRTGHGLVLYSMERGPILPAYGIRDRDRRLRQYDRHEYNNLWQGATSGFYKKVASTPWEITGQGDVAYYQQVIQDAHFGQGWKYFVMRAARDHHTQDFGMVIEIIGPGDPTGPLSGPVAGIAVLDSLRCWATGNPDHPIVYFSAITNKMHRLHRTRVARFVDMPSGDERHYGNGLCALSRYIAVAQREILMGRYIESYLDDKPKPGFNIASNITQSAVEASLAKYEQQQSADEMPEWGRTMWLYSLDPREKAEVNTVTFSTPPEKFDFKTYTELHINALALALGVDKQELWELGSGSLGSGAQSEILAQKARGKAFGDFLSTLERFVNMSVLPPGLTFTFKYKDEEEDKAQTDKDQALIGVAEGLKRLGFDNQTIANLLADRSETFRELLTNDAGQVMVANELSDAPVTDQTVADTTPQVEQPGAAPPIAAFAGGAKDYGATKAEFVGVLSDLIRGGLADDLSRRRFGIVMRSHLRRLGQQAYEDGLRAGGVTGEVDDADLTRVQDWLGEQSGYVSHFADSVYKEGLSPADVSARAELWANKSLELMYQEGLKSADENGAYEWVLGSADEHCETCKRLAGQIHRLRGWYSKGLLPRRDKLDCKGFNCKCQLRRTPAPATGRF